MEDPAHRALITTELDEGRTCKAALGRLTKGD